MRWVACLLVGCAASTSGVPYLDDRGVRRSELEAELVNPANGYSRLRLAYYALDRGGWDALPEANPRGEPIAARGEDPSAPLSPGAAALDVAIDPRDDAALRALGEDAFFHYPVEIIPANGALAAEGADYGLWLDPARGYGGLERVVLADGRIAIAMTCATCHASVRDSALVPGLANERFELGQLLVDAGDVASENAPAFAAWGRGRLDVTTTTGVEPVRIPDLRKTAWQTHLQADATVRRRDLASLAIRIETLIIVSREETVRPPRVVALALATYLTSLADSLPPMPDAAAPGAAVFASRCAGCHAAPALTGPPIALDVVGTDPTLGRSADRGTGTYQVPSLHGVGARGLLLHDGALASLAAMFDPARQDPSYTGGVRPGAVVGHPFGLDLDASDRADLLAYLEML